MGIWWRLTRSFGIAAVLGLGLPGCSSIYGPLAGPNPNNCNNEPSLCTGSERCDIRTGICVAPADDTALAVTSAAPAAGANNVATWITLTGRNFLSGVNVTVGGAECTGVRVLSSTQLTCRVPPRAVQLRQRGRNRHPPRHAAPSHRCQAFSLPQHRPICRPAPPQCRSADGLHRQRRLQPRWKARSGTGNQPVDRARLARARRWHVPGTDGLPGRACTDSSRRGGRLGEL